jgi:hypothetical protein
MRSLTWLAVFLGVATVVAWTLSSAKRSQASGPVGAGTHVEDVERSFAGQSQAQLLAALESRKQAANALKDELLAELVAQGRYEERFEPTAQAPARLESEPVPDAVAGRIDIIPAEGGRIVRMSYLLRGDDPALDRLVDEIDWLAARTQSAQAP